MDSEKTTLSTNVSKAKTKNPTYGNINGYIHYRGTLDDLTDLLLQV